jgi:hypothetical protein
MFLISYIAGLIPEPQQDLTTIFARFADAGGFTPADVVALLASHTIARSDHIEPGLKTIPFDSTPFVVSRYLDRREYYKLTPVCGE